MKSIFFIFFAFMPALAFAQAADEKFEAALMQTKTGALLAYNGTAHAFTIRVVGNVVPPTKEMPNFLTVNGQILQATIIPYASNGDVSDLSEETMKKFLIGYQQYESNYFKKELKIGIANEKTTFMRLENHLFLDWEYDTPPALVKNKTIKHAAQKTIKQLYLVSICFNQALVLNCPIAKAADVEQAKTLLAATAVTLLLQDAPLDLTELYHQLENE